jgi:NADP-dependent 3-hydroxy acid dehydrogenase YdfG
MDLRNTTAVVTGAASGIGRALARHIHQRGAQLIVADRDAEALHATAHELDARAVTMDVAAADDNERLASTAGAPRLLCLNAGVVSTAPGPVWEAPPDEWRRVVDINLGGVVNGLRAFIPRMLATSHDHNVLTTASLAGLATWPGGGPYAASKHAVITVAEQAALALVDHPVTITVLCSALVRTGMSDTGDDPDDVAVTALDAVDQGRFTVLPAEWTEAVRRRASRLADGLPPQQPTPRP